MENSSLSSEKKSSYNKFLSKSRVKFGAIAASAVILLSACGDNSDKATFEENANQNNTGETNSGDQYSQDSAGEFDPAQLSDEIKVSGAFNNNTRQLAQQVVEGLSDKDMRLSETYGESEIVAFKNYKADGIPIENSEILEKHDGPLVRVTLSDTEMEGTKSFFDQPNISFNVVYDDDKKPGAIDSRELVFDLTIPDNSEVPDWPSTPTTNEGVPAYLDWMVEPKNLAKFDPVYLYTNPNSTPDDETRMGVMDAGVEVVGKSANGVNVAKGLNDANSQFETAFSQR